MSGPAASALAKRSGRVPGTNSRLRRGWIFGSLIPSAPLCVPQPCRALPWTLPYPSVRCQPAGPAPAGRKRTSPEDTIGGRGQGCYTRSGTGDPDPCAELPAWSADELTPARRSRAPSTRCGIAVRTTTAPMHRRRRGARPAPPVDHRSRRRPSADRERGRHAVGRLQRRDLQLSRAARASWSAKGHRFRDPLRHRGHRCTSTRSCGEALPRAGCAACSRSRSGTRPPQRLFAARDRLGQKPLLLRASAATRSAFASEIKALLALDRACAELDLAALHQYLALRVIAPPRSMFRGIRKLPPAHCLTFGDERGPADRALLGPRLRAQAQGLRGRAARASSSSSLIECVRLHMVSDVPVGAFLSGGLDSTLVVALLDEARGQGADPDLHHRPALRRVSTRRRPPALVAERYGTPAPRAE